MSALLLIWAVSLMVIQAMGKAPWNIQTWTLPYAHVALETQVDHGPIRPILPRGIWATGTYLDEYKRLRVRTLFDR
jgi:hypothetical protein